ncbi:MAG TPA: GAF and ANTAR domain-containing protein [Actinomycetota bacterium]
MTSNELDPGRSDLAASFAEISRALYSAHTVQETLHRIVTFSVDTIDGCSGAGISFVQGDQIVTPVWTEPKVLEVDLMQYTTGQGPCLDAIARGESFYAEDLLTDPRWPDFGPRAAQAGMRSLLSFCLFGEAPMGALNLYARLPSAFGATDRATGVIFATHAGVALAAAQDVEDAAQALAVEIERLDNLHGALASRQVIGRAEGILMQRERVTADQAFDLLRRASQHLNIKLREVAQHVVDTGDLPHSSGEDA